jgi:hypothetical protein
MRFQSVLYKGDPDDEEARFDWAAKHQRGYTKQELFFDWDPEGRVLESYFYDEPSGVMTIKREQHAQSLLDDNNEWRQSEQTWRKKDDRWLRYASIPTLVAELWMKEGINVLHAETDRNGVPNEHLKAVLKKLRDPDWKWLKTVDMDMGDGSTEGNTRLAHIPGNGFPWMVKDDLVPLKPPKPYVPKPLPRSFGR